MMIDDVVWFLTNLDLALTHREGGVADCHNAVRGAVHLAGARAAAAGSYARHRLLLEPRTRASQGHTG